MTGPLRVGRHRCGASPPIGLALTLALGLALVAPSCALIDRPDTYEVGADFRRAVNLYPGSPVRALGIEVGSITEVENRGDVVRVTMRIDEGTALPADARAVVVPVTVLGERYVQLSPVYDGGPRLAAGAVIPRERTQVPFEIDELLRGLDDYLGQIDPDRAGDLITNLADLLEGQGAELNDLIANASGTVELLADKGDELGAIVESLSQLTATLGGRTQAVQELIRSYGEVAGQLAADRDDLNAFITNLDRAAVELGGLLERNREPLRASIDTLAVTGRTVERNIDRLVRALDATPRLFAAAARAYDADRNVLRLNNQVDSSLALDLYRARLRDRLAGLCRRIIVALGGPTAAAAAGLVAADCGNAASPIWDPLVADDPLAAAAPEPPAADGPAGPDLPSVDLPDLPAADLPLPDLPTLADGLDLLAGLVDPSQLASLQGLDPALLAAIDALDDRQVLALALLTPDQLAALRGVPADQLGATLDRIIAGSLDPASLLDQPLLPPSGRGPGSGGGGDRGAGGIGSGLAGVLAGGGR
ncbi:MAG: MCE family protein [Acidimicrobiales bacterium]|nr:MCE family protein [Acidimicrobiales bacterium]